MTHTINETRAHAPVGATLGNVIVIYTRITTNVQEMGKSLGNMVRIGGLDPDILCDAQKVYAGAYQEWLTAREKLRQAFPRQTHVLLPWWKGEIND
jgi:hypothetical protein